MIGSALLWALAGWCGNVPFHWPGTPNPPDPDPWWMRGGIGVLGGILMGWVVTQVLPGEHMAASVFGALAGGKVVGDILNGNRGKTA